MAKRHHNSRHESKERTRDMGYNERHEMMDRHSYDGFRGAESYTGGMKAMKEGGGMMHEDRSKPANLPVEVMDKNFERGHYGIGGHIEDLYMGVQKQLRTDSADIHRELKPGKY